MEEILRLQAEVAVAEELVFILRTLSTSGSICQ